MELKLCLAVRCHDPHQIEACGCQQLQTAQHFDRPPFEVTAAEQILVERLLRRLDPAAGNLKLLAAGQDQRVGLGDLVPDAIGDADAICLSLSGLRLGAVLQRAIAHAEVLQRPDRGHVKVHPRPGIPPLNARLVAGATEIARAQAGRDKRQPRADLLLADMDLGRCDIGAAGA